MLCTIPSSARKGSFGRTQSVISSPLSPNFVIWQIRISLEEMSQSPPPPPHPPVDDVLLELSLQPARPPSCYVRDGRQRRVITLAPPEDDEVEGEIEKRRVGQREARISNHFSGFVSLSPVFGPLQKLSRFLSMGSTPFSRHR